MRARSLLLCFLVVAIFTPAASRAAPYAPQTYTLQVLPGEAHAISDTGWVVGGTNGSGYRWRAGKTENLAEFHSALGVNNAGDVVGPYNGFRFGTEPGLLLTASGPQYFAAPTSMSSITPRSINDAGLIAGFEHEVRSRPRSFGKGAMDLAPAPILNYGAGEANAVNAQGWIAGWSGDLYDYFLREGDRPMLWKPGKAVVLPLPPTATGAHLTALSDTGLVGGAFWRAQEFNNGESYPYLMDLWTGAVVLYPAINNGTVNGINNAGLAVGERVGADGSKQAVLYAPDGRAYDLKALVANSGAWQLRQAFDIDNLGRIVGLIWRGNQEVAGFLLTPNVAARYTPPSGGR